MASINRDRNQLLSRIMAKRQLTQEDIANKLDVPLDTVKAWLRNPGDDGFEVIPKKEMQLLLYDLKFDIYEINDG